MIFEKRLKDSIKKQPNRVVCHMGQADHIPFKGCLPQILLGPFLNTLTYKIDTKMIKQFQGFFVAFLNRNTKYNLIKGSIPREFKKTHERGLSNSEK